MSGNHHKDGEWNDDVEEYDEGILFEEFVARAEENFEDPELETIAALLEKMGFIIRAEHLNRRVVASEFDGTRTVEIIANLALVDDKLGEEVITLRQRKLSAPILNAELTSRDQRFLKEAGINW